MLTQKLLSRMKFSTFSKIATLQWGPLRTPRVAPPLRAVSAVLASYLVFTCAPCAAAPVAWNLPRNLAPANTEITFEVDSTWHTVHGRAKELSGEVTLGDSNDFHSVEVALSIPVSALDTSNDDRDEKMRRVMGAGEFPEIKFRMNGIPDLVDPASMAPGVPYPFVAMGTISIRAIERPIECKATVTRSPTGSFHIHGAGTLAWPDFGVEDPSIFIAKVEPEVAITFDVELARDSA